MVSAKFVHLIESHAEQIADRVLNELRRDERRRQIAALPEAELREVCQRILRNLGHWLTAASEQEIGRYYEERGRIRAAESVPLHEVVYLFLLLKSRMLDFVRNQGFPHTSVDVYAAEELEHAVGRFFDCAVYHLVRGYEAALRGM